MPAFHRAVLLLLDSLVLAAVARAAEPALLLPLSQHDGVVSPLRLHVSEDLSPSLALRVARARSVLGAENADGAGAGVPAEGISGLETLQVLYDTPEYGPTPDDGNAVLVSWSEDGTQTSIVLEITGFEPAELTPLRRAGGRFVVISGFPRCEPAGGPECAAVSFASCTGTAAKPNLFEFSVVGSTGRRSVCQEVLRTWPVANGAGFCCRPGDVAPGACEAQIGVGETCSDEIGPAPDACSIIVSGTNSGPTASAVFVLAGDAQRAELALDVAATISEPSAVECFSRRLSFDISREYVAAMVALLNRAHAFETTWIDPVSEESYSQLEGAFLGADVIAFLGHGVSPAVSCSSIASCSASEVRFRRGFANSDSELDLTDGVYLLNYLFLRGTEPSCLDAIDLDDSGALDLSDALNAFNFLFLRAPPFPAPFEECGTDSTEDALDCRSASPAGC